jgi:hypothetical protein
MRFLASWTIGSICFASVVAIPAIAQEHQGCFMTDGSGQMFDLGELCPASPSLPPTAAAPSSSPTQRTVEVLPGYRQGNGSDDHWISGLNMVRRYAPGQWSGYVLNRGPHGFEEPGGGAARLSSDSYDGLSSSYSGSSSGSGSSGSGRCNVPTNIAADGSICGGRASSVRPGGR